MTQTPAGAACAFLMEEEVSKRYRGAVSPGTLRNWRSKGVGPPFLKVGKSVLYPLEGLVAWERRQTCAGG
jgi:hypothetical protein